MEARQTCENLDVQAFKNLNAKIEDEFLAGAVNYLTTFHVRIFVRRRRGCMDAW